MADTFGHRFVRARKAHECYACRAGVLLGAALDWLVTPRLPR
jgi:hypothetical protein